MTSSTVMSHAQFGLVMRGTHAATAQAPVAPWLWAGAKALGLDPRQTIEYQSHHDQNGNYLGRSQTVTRGRTTKTKNFDAQDNLVRSSDTTRPLPYPLNFHQATTTNTMRRVTTPEERLQARQRRQGPGASPESGPEPTPTGPIGPRPGGPPFGGPPPVDLRPYNYPASPPATSTPWQDGGGRSDYGDPRV